MASLNAICQRTAKLIPRAFWQHAIRPFSICSHSVMSCSNRMQSPSSNSFQYFSPTSLLSPSSVLVTPAAGMKQMGRLRRRCKHCFFIMIDERLHVWCDVHPRHKQQQMIKQPKSIVITTHATQGKIRPW